jgi:ABC-type multidrug transport system ATPase subunit
LDIAAGTIFGFLGPNGAGKTTTIRMLLGLVAPTSGACWLFPYAIEQHGIPTRGWFFYLPQRAHRAQSTTTTGHVYLKPSVPSVAYMMNNVSL